MIIYVIPFVSFQISQESIVPNAKLPRSAFLASYSDLHAKK